VNVDGLPRLCYIGNVPVESSIHGSALLWRLLEPYPREKLLVIECEYQSATRGRLPGVAYASANMRAGRLLRSRVAPLALPFLFRFSRFLAGPIRAEAEKFAPQAILTVANGLHWKIASEIATALKIPLHLIVHDAVLQMITEKSALKAEIDRSFARVYAGAASRLCVSPYMEAKYLERYGVAGTVLYPSRARRSVVFETPAQRPVTPGRGLTGVFAGSIFPSYAEGLAQLARALRTSGGRLLIFGPADWAAGEGLGLALDNVEFRGMRGSEELKTQCRDEADFLFVPMSFRDAERTNAEISFPSKIADYTAIGCPLLIRGPSYCSAVRWARENPGVAEIVDTEDPAALEQALASLGSPERRMSLGREALRLGEVFFSASRADRVLRDALSNGQHRPAGAEGCR
jgi:hypothetical protein